MKRAAVILVMVWSAAFYWLHQRAALPGRTLHLYIYANYIEPSVIEQFKQDYSVQVIEENCSSNEEVEGKLKAGATGYDIIVPSDYMVKRLAAAGLLAPLDHTLLPNLKFLDRRFKRPRYDPQGTYAVPYMWGTTGIGYRKSMVHPAPQSWAQFFDPAWLAPLQQRVSLLDDPREVIGAALKRDGHSINSTHPQELDQARSRLRSILPYIGRIDSNNYKDLLASADLWMVQGYSGDIIKLQENNPDIVYIIPEEGATIWADNLAIPVSSSNKELAHLFIDFAMRPEINAKIASFIHYATTNKAAKGLIPHDQLANTNIYPSEAIMAKLEWFTDLSDQSILFDTLWNELRSTSASQAAGRPESENMERAAP